MKIHNKEFKNQRFKKCISKESIENLSSKYYHFDKTKKSKILVKSIALRDADDVFDDIIKNGLK